MFGVDSQNEIMIECQVEGQRFSGHVAFGAVFVIPTWRARPLPFVRTTRLLMIAYTYRKRFNPSSGVKNQRGRMKQSQQLSGLPL